MWFPVPTARMGGENSAKNCALHRRNLNQIRKSDLAAVGHGLELLAILPRLRLVPWHLGSAMIVWIADQGCFLLRRARSQRGHECAHQNGNDN